MTTKIIESLHDLKINPKLETVDHISILHDLYWEYSNGVTELKPIALFYINGFDDLHALREKHLWNLEKYNQVRKHFVESHFALTGIVNQILNTM